MNGEQGVALRIAIWVGVARERIMDALAGVPDLDIAEAADAAGFIAALEGAQVAVLPGLPRFYGPEVGAKIASSADMAWVHLISAGYDGVSAAGWPPGVKFTHPGGALSGAVAEHAFALLTALSRRLDQAVLGQIRHAWAKPYAQQATTLSGATLAIIGFGSIGQRAARLAKGYDMKVIGVSNSGRPVEGYEVHPASALLEVLPRADAVICALPYREQTRHLLDAQAFARFKPGAYFVNVGRGGVVDQAALIEALKSGALAGAGLDVTDPEPLPEGDPLWTAPNVLITPHYAAAGDREAAALIAQGLVENIRRFRSGEPLLNPLSPGL